MPNYEMMENLLRRAKRAAPRPLILTDGFNLRPCEEEELRQLRELVDAGLMSFYGHGYHRGQFSQYLVQLKLILGEY